MKPASPILHSEVRFSFFRAIGALFYRHLVHLTILMVLGGTYVIAWCKSVEIGDRRMFYPAPARSEDGKPLIGERAFRVVAVDADELDE
jgi:hypothetical protein